MEDYTSKYKGEHVEVALFGGDYQEGVLTAYCFVEDVAHIELNGHILVPLQNIASLHCSSRCDAPEPDWPPRGLTGRTGRTSPRRLGCLLARNVLKVWRSSSGCCAPLGGIGWLLGGYGCCPVRVRGLLLAAGMWWYADRAVLGLVRAQELPLAEAAGLHSTVERLAAQAGVSKPRLYVMRDGLPRACSAGRGPRSSAVAVSRGLLQALPPGELEGVLAHELAHIRHRDVFVQSVAVVTAAVIVETSRIGGWVTRWLLFVLGPVASAFVHLLLSPKREFDADRAAAISADTARACVGARTARPGERPRAVRGEPRGGTGVHLQSLRAEGAGGLFSTHPPVAERVRQLRALDRDAPVLGGMKKGRSRGPSKTNSAASYSPGRVALRVPWRWRA